MVRLTPRVISTEASLVSTCRLGLSPTWYDLVHSSAKAERLKIERQERRIRMDLCTKCLQSWIRPGRRNCSTWNNLMGPRGTTCVPNAGYASMLAPVASGVGDASECLLNKRNGCPMSWRATVLAFAFSRYVKRPGTTATCASQCSPFSAPLLAACCRSSLALQGSTLVRACCRRSALPPCCSLHYLASRNGA